MRQQMITEAEREKRCEIRVNGKIMGEYKKRAK